ncbi:GEM-like protein 5 [Rhododendron vialii]|uniref:GEM-like protein 5 n=1 Tax=Rhododendron vialii TaxID=182163 RepID=UPI00266053C4|nr:GEM-like protein 5 [Rhododendron vialii]
MNGGNTNTTNPNTTDDTHPLYPSLFSPTGSSKQPQPSVTDQPPPPPSSLPAATPPPNAQQTQPQPQPPYQPEPGPSSSTSDHHPDAETSEKWGTHIMGAPAVPTSHPGNQKAATWSAGSDDQPQNQPHHPYLQYSPVAHKPNSSPMESILSKFNTWSKKAETTAQNIWLNLKTGSSVSGAAWDKVNLTAKAMTGGGFETLFKQTFATLPNEKLKKTFACYLSTTTGPVAGTIYLSNVHVAFCSDRPLSFTAPSGQETWSYYKVMVPLVKICAINPVVMRDNQSEKYLQIVTIDGHDFWFMGFVNYEKATRHLSESLGGYVAPGIAVQQPVVA